MLCPGKDDAREWALAGHALRGPPPRAPAGASDRAIDPAEAGPSHRANCRCAAAAS